MSRLAIIPARGGSKRIPRKNIRLFCGQPIIAYSIEAALASGLFTTVMVSTDDVEIAEIAKHYGAEVPFMRSEATANDYATTAAVLTEVLQAYQQEKLTFNATCCLYPTAPFITAGRLVAGWELLVQGHYQTVMSVQQFSFPIQRALQRDAAGRVQWLWPENALRRSQDLPPAYHDAGQFYWFDTAAFLASQQLLMPNTGAIVLNDLEAHDIDTEADWLMAEFKYAYAQQHS